MKKIIRIGTQEEHNRQGKPIQADIFCAIKYEDKKLSISGVIGPVPNGDCLGSCGQIVDSIKPDHFASSWNKTKLKKLINIWDAWHLNDMKPYTVAMQKEGWDKLASKEIFKFSFDMTDEARKEFKELERALISAGINQKVLPLDARQKRLLQSETYKDIYSYETPEAPEFMHQSIHWQTKQPEIEKKTLGWVSVEEHPDGLLSRELNGEKYGCKWFHHEIPADVIEWLSDLPDADKQPAWRL